ncbi:hypothetical protein RJT34_03301 [Clitoria ternatea]|uniref:VQ domain-containing protein n=1 Tax=Clitoria ternatea TaxID=43366 RepID=A0AAN9KLY5_CLITE
MDSGNSSGSIQSSSGGEEEYDSRAESSSSLSAFLNNQVVNQPPLVPFTTSTTPLILPQHHHMFDPPLSNYLDPIRSITNPNSILNIDTMWPKPVRSEPNQTELVHRLIPCSSSSPLNQQQQAFVSSQTRGGANNNTTVNTHQNLPPESGSRGLMLSVSGTSNDQTHSNNTNTVRNPKKRSRASRRAPTTVLTTDTTNFRAMVQEFTGIPAPPFTSSSFPRTRFDLFASAAAAATSTLRSNNPLDPPTAPPYLLRPFAQKLRNFQSFPPSSFDTLLPSNNSTNNSTTNSTSINYQQQQLPEHLDLMKQYPLNFSNPVLGFQNQNTLQPKYPLGDSPVLVSKTQTSLEIPPNLKMGVFEELGLRHDHVNTDLNCPHQHNMVSSTSVGVGALSSGTNNNNNNNLSIASSTEWAQRTGTITNNDCDHNGEGGGSLSGTVNYSDIAERVTNGKVHYLAASSSDFHGEKGLEFTVGASRSQGMVESWINCSSD